jgi:hypothetical protein
LTRLSRHTKRVNQLYSTSAKPIEGKPLEVVSYKADMAPGCAVDLAQQPLDAEEIRRMRPDPLGIEGVRPAECEAIRIHETGDILSNIGALHGIYAR